MPRVCEFTGKRTTTGFSYTLRGKKKYLGGVGTKITGKTKRTFKPNLQKVTCVMPDGSVKRILASTRAIRNGLVVKPTKRKYAYTAKQKAAAAATAEA
ncbi:MAG: 50S ribosomal protein L28 [Planctomycetota bacterium]